MEMSKPSSSSSEGVVWKDDVREWPKLNFQDICNYFVHAPACDSQPNANYRSIVEGQNYLSSGWIGRIEHRIVGNNIITLKGNVRFSQAINNYHKVQITVNDATITKLRCDCIASEGKCCSHSAGLAFKIVEANDKGYIGMACTDEPCRWNRSTQHNVLPDSIENIRCVKKKSTENNVSFETDSEVTEHLSAPHLQGLSSIPGTILHQIAVHERTSAQIDNVCFVHESHELPLNCSICRDVYYTYVQMSPSEAEHISQQTLNQKSSLWTSHRRRRITSSVAATIPRKVDTDPSKWLKKHFSPGFGGNADTRYGQIHEPCAREKFERDTGTKITLSGLVIRSEDSWLGASLDGILDDNTILEIKCPTEKKLARYNSSVKGLIESGTYDVRVDDSGLYYLRQTSAASGYYTQVQIAMHCSNRKLCKFMVWSPNDYIIADVPYDQKWIKEKMAFLKNFYFVHMLPVLTDMVLKKELKLI